MGTNYYAKVDVCKTCGRAKEEIHIGKLSWGWDFDFAYDTAPSYEEMVKFVTKYKKSLYNEYGDKILLKHMIECFNTRKGAGKKLLKPEDIKYFQYIDGYRFMKGEFS